MNQLSKLFLGILLLIGTTITTSFSQAFKNADEAFSSASSANKKVLLVFSGSDWCAPCVQLENKILSTTTFIDFADKNLVIIHADFPQRKKLSKEIQSQNDALAEQYNPTGEFPEIVLLRSDKSVVKKLSYNNQSTDEFINEITPYLSK
ncbi:MAG: thioredoxin family protein [Chryseolinea sp.]